MSDFPANPVPKSEQEVQAEHARNRDHVRVFLVALPFAIPLVMAPSYLATRFLGEAIGSALGYLGIGLTVAAVAYMRHVTSRCPACQGAFGKYFFGSSCPHCGVRLK